jgi:hypothetical protein
MFIYLSLPCTHVITAYDLALIVCHFWVAKTRSDRGWEKRLSDFSDVNNTYKQYEDFRYLVRQN